MRAERQTHVLRLEEYFIAPCPAFATHARCLRPAERLPQIAHVLAVDEAHTGFDRSGNAVCTTGILGPDVARQTVGDVVRESYCIGFVVERNQARNRAENLFLRDAHPVVDIDEYR